MRALPVLMLLGLAACGRSDEAGVNTQELERIAIQHNQVEDIGASARLQPLAGITPPSGYAGPVCRFVRGGDTLIFAFSASAAARVNGSIRVFRAAGPVGPTGGFFRDRELALSIGVESGSPARARTTNRVSEAREDAEGEWACSAPAG